MGLSLCCSGPDSPSRVGAPFLLWGFLSLRNLPDSPPGADQTQDLYEDRPSERKLSSDWFLLLLAFGCLRLRSWRLVREPSNSVEPCGCQSGSCCWGGLLSTGGHESGQGGAHLGLGHGPLSWGSVPSCLGGTSSPCPMDSLEDGTLDSELLLPNVCSVPVSDPSLSCG